MAQPEGAAPAVPHRDSRAAAAAAGPSGSDRSFPAPLLSAAPQPSCSQAGAPASSSLAPAVAQPYTLSAWEQQGVACLVASLRRWLEEGGGGGTEDLPWTLPFGAKDPGALLDQLQDALALPHLTSAPAAPLRLEGHEAALPLLSQRLPVAGLAPLASLPPLWQSPDAMRAPPGMSPCPSGAQAGPSGAGWMEAPRPMLEAVGRDEQMDTEEAVGENEWEEEVPQGASGMAARHGRAAVGEHARGTSKAGPTTAGSKKVDKIKKRLGLR